VRAGLEAARGDSLWLDPERLLAEIRDPRTSPATARRFYLNQIHADEDKPFDVHRFAALSRPGHPIPAGALVTLGFDGSLTRDHTALVVVEVATGHCSLAGYFEPRPRAVGVAEIDRPEVDEVVRYAFDRWNVWRMNADPYKWDVWLNHWAGIFGEDKVASWSTTNKRRMAMTLGNLSAAINAGELSHDGDPRLMAAIANSHKRMLNTRDDDNELEWVIQKERPDSPLKIDAAIALTLAWDARNEAIASGVLQTPTVGVMFVGAR
jgi:hypothetical protein